VAIIFSTNPVFTIPFAHFILKEDLKKSTIFSLVLSLIGIACILNPFQASQGTDIKGIILCVISALTFSIYSVIGKMRASRYGSIVMNCITFLVGDVIMLILIGISKISTLTGLDYHKANEYEQLALSIKIRNCINWSHRFGF
jgi:drug/metabolite transporter (DMT)-like permease